MMFEGIIFDFNGFLWEDSDLHERAWQQFSLTVRPEELSLEEINIYIHGRNAQDTFEYLLDRPVDVTELNNLVEQKESIYRRLCLDKEDAFALSNSTITLLDYLAENNIPRTIATASGITNLEFFIQQFHLKKWFDITKIVYDDATILGKPAPDFYIKAASKLSLNPADCIVVEDSLSGIDSARSAGIGHIIAFGPSQTHCKLKQYYGVNSVLSTFNNFPFDLLRD